MIRVGAHISIQRSIDLSIDRARAIGCQVFQIFSRNPRVWTLTPLTTKISQVFYDKMRESALLPVVHMPYLPNLASPREEIYRRSVQALSEEVDRCGLLGIPYLVLHPGHHLGAGLEEGRKRICSAINTVIERLSESSVTLLVENTAGEKNGMGSTFEEIEAILGKIEREERVGICWDTCHAFAAGYTLSTEREVGETFDRLEEIIGWNSVRVIHMNDCKGELGSGLDRHEHIGLGGIGDEGFRQMLRYSEIRRLPLICETPIDGRRDDRGNLERVRELALNDKHLESDSSQSDYEYRN